MWLALGSAEFVAELARFRVRQKKVQPFYQRMHKPCYIVVLLFLVVASLAVSGGAAWATNSSYDISATDSYVSGLPDRRRRRRSHRAAGRQ